ncbi:hypothetical protein F8M41_015975 [Gigaspora margarita]|uniref:Uncharacterized protein n=1 Tax=Gigaspora margarita TaxID=4874 RepID=A0A8H3WX99_GIGMA|nr:hypothetical protein F8M41_015975 [Gigaspora margarita]
MTHPEISNELEILSNVHYPLEFPTGITTPDDAVGQQIPEISSGPVLIQQIFHPNISQPYPLLPISTTDNIPPFFDQLSTKSNSTGSFPPSPTSPSNIPSRYLLK